METIGFDSSPLDVKRYYIINLSTFHFPGKDENLPERENPENSFFGKLEKEGKVLP